MAVQLLTYFSLKPFEDVQKIIDEHNTNLGKWVAQTELANEMTELVHGKEGLKLAQQCSKVLFEGTGILGIEKIRKCTFYENSKNMKFPKLYFFFLIDFLQV